MKVADAIYRCRCCKKMIRIPVNRRTADNIAPTFAECVSSFQINHRCENIKYIYNLNEGENVCVFLDLIGYTEHAVKDQFSLVNGSNNSYIGTLNGTRVQ